METLDLATIADIAANLSLSAVLLYLLVTERKNHDDTRKTAREDLLRLIQEQTETLKEIAGIRANMWQVQAYRNREGDTRPLPPLNGEG